jgi:NAD(P)-dependent dehydrogenase (short-subunit alcohol dehydrogenase family)
VLVTGASTGIGAATVQALVAAGVRVWAGVRREKDGQRLTIEYGDRVRVLRFDLTDGEAVAAAGERVVAAGPLDGVVCNAGVPLAGPLEFLPIASLREQLEVNVLGQLRVIQAVLPAVRAGSGRIVVVGSIGGRIAGPMLGAYHASKFAPGRVDRFAAGGAGAVAHPCDLGGAGGGRHADLGSGPGEGRPGGGRDARSGAGGVRGADC